MKTLLRDIRITISRRFVAWFSVVVIMLIGVSGILGLMYVGNSIERKVTEVFAKTKFKDFEVVSNLGVTKDDIQKLSDVQGIEDVEGFYRFDGIIASEGRSDKVVLISTSESISVPYAVEGELPSREDECALDPDYMSENSISIGDTVELKCISDTFSNVLKEKSFTVTGAAHHPDYLMRGNVYDKSRTVILSEDAFDTASLDDIYIGAYLRLRADKNLTVYSDKYMQFAKPVEDALRDRVEEIGKERYEKLVEKYSAQTDIVPRCYYYVENREMNYSYVENKRLRDAVGDVGTAFTPLFAIVAFMVCFSTLVIVIDDEKRQIGTYKALGLFNREIRLKYMIYGLSAVIVGAVLGLALSFLIEDVILDALSERFSFGAFPVVGRADASIVFICSIVCASAVVMYIACHRLLRCAAAGLVKGYEPVRRVVRGTGRATKRALYSRAILNNIRMDRERVLVSVAVILGCTVLVGTGFTMKYGAEGAFVKQEGMNLYDLKISFLGDDKKATYEQASEILDEYGASYIPITSEIHFVKAGDQYDAVSVLCADGDKISEYIGVKSVDGKDIRPMNVGATIRMKMAEVWDVKRGGKITLYGNNLKPYEVTVTGDYASYIDQTVLMTPAGYLNAFKSEPETNGMFVICGDEVREEISKKLEDFSEYIQVETADYFSTLMKPVRQLTNAAVGIMLALSVLLSFIILVNLNNILIKRRMKELIIMRINGFTKKEVSGYIAREAALITFLGILLGVIVGIPFAKNVVMMIEGVTIMNIRTPFLSSWIYAVGLNVLFSICTYAISYRNVKKGLLTDVKKY